MFRGHLLLFGWLALLSGCNLFENDLTNENLQVVFTAANGWGFNQSLTISSNGIVTLNSTYPELSRPLTDEEFDRFKKLFHRYQYLEYESKFYCADNIHLNIQITQNDDFKYFHVDTCIFSTEEEWSEAVERFYQIQNFMYDLYEMVYNELSPWIDLEVEYSLNNSTYSLGEEIVASYQIYNPTESARHIGFQKGVPIYFSTQKSFNNSHYYFSYPQNYHRLDDNPLMIWLEPGESKTFSFSWNQSFTDGDSTVSAVPGTYTINTWFLSNELPGKRTTIEIAH